MGLAILSGKCGAGRNGPRWTVSRSNQHCAESDQCFVVYGAEWMADGEQRCGGGVGVEGAMQRDRGEHRDEWSTSGLSLTLNPLN